MFYIFDSQSIKNGDYPPLFKVILIKKRSALQRLLYLHVMIDTIHPRGATGANVELYAFIGIEPIE